MKTENNGDFGSKWRILAHSSAGSVGMEDQGTFDELVVDDWLHIEQMDDDVWWLRVGDARVMVTLASQSEPTVDVERGFYAAPKGSTKTRE